MSRPFVTRLIVLEHAHPGEGGAPAWWKAAEFFVPPRCRERCACGTEFGAPNVDALAALLRQHEKRCRIPYQWGVLR